MAEHSDRVESWLCPICGACRVPLSWVCPKLPDCENPPHLTGRYYLLREQETKDKPEPQTLGIGAISND